MSDLNHLDCPFCRRSGDGNGRVYIKDEGMLRKHFDGLLPEKLECHACGASAKKVIGCCSIKYVWICKMDQKDYQDVARFECSDCGSHYYARIQERGGRFEIGQKVEEPPAHITVRRQRMLCGDCRGKGGAGDQLQNIIEEQRRMMGGY